MTKRFEKTTLSILKAKNTCIQQRAVRYISDNYDLVFRTKDILSEYFIVSCRCSLGARMAQLLEALTTDPRVRGSSP